MAGGRKARGGYFLFRGIACYEMTLLSFDYLTLCNLAGACLWAGLEMIRINSWSCLRKG